MMRTIRIAALLALTVLAGALAWQWYQTRQSPREPLPALALEPLEGREGFDPAGIGEAYLLNVWGSWCAPCRIEHPVLMALQAEGIAIYGINWRDHPDDANAFLDELGNPYAGIMQDVNGASARALAISGAPETLVISRDGDILVRWPGPITADVLRNRIYPALEREARRR
ncbi:redoxin family protein [Maricaulis sp.]|uniref:redoxin family protein n=1 Tax=Maricaulis sp. TaxID=1486257 RepID=UPI0026146007|nr:redoxin family protein [Maricaulis sp.]